MQDSNFVSLRFLLEMDANNTFFFTSLFLSERVSGTETNKEGEEGVAKLEQSRTTDQINDRVIRNQTDDGDWRDEPSMRI